MYRVYGMYGMCSAFLLLFCTELRENSLRLSFLFLNFLIPFLKFPVTFFSVLFFQETPEKYFMVASTEIILINNWFLIKVGPK